MFCRKCGTQISDDSIFCSKCGTRVENSQPVAKKEVQQEFTCPNCGGHVTFGSGWYRCDNGCGYEYNANVANNTHTCRQVDNEPEKQESGINKKYLAGAIAFVVLGFIFFRGILYYNILSSTVMLLAAATAWGAMKDKKYAKMIISIVVGLVLFAGITILKEQHKKDTRNFALSSGKSSGLAGISTSSFDSKKGIDPSIIKDIDVNYEPKTEVFSKDNVKYFLFKNRIVRIDDNKYEVLVCVKQNVAAVNHYEIDIKDKTVKQLNCSYFDDKGKWRETVNIPSPEINTFNYCSAENGVVKYILSGQADKNGIMVDKSIIDLGDLRYGMSPKDIELRYPDASRLKGLSKIKVLNVDNPGISVYGFPVDYLWIYFDKNDKVCACTLFMSKRSGRYMEYEYQDEIENKEANGLIKAARHINLYIATNLSTAVSYESIDVNNNYIEPIKGKYLTKSNDYFWWTKNSVINLEGCKNVSDIGVRHRLTIDIKAK